MIKTSRRSFLKGTGAAVAYAASPVDAVEDSFELRYMLASSMYGKTSLEEILPEVKRTGSESIDIWPMGHANQREQIEAMGHDRFRDLLEKHDVSLGMTTRYDLGPYRLQNEMTFVKAFGGHQIVCGAKNANGDTLKEKVSNFVKSLAEPIRLAEDLGVTIGIENHSGSLISSADSIKYFCDLSPSKHLGIALAPYHLPQDDNLIAQLIEHSNEKLAHFYAWQHGMGCHKPMPKPLELLQLPGQGVLDFGPAVKALAKINYDRHVEIFMHPTPRGIPIVDGTQAVGDVINHAREYMSRAIGRSGV